MHFPRFCVALISLVLTCVSIVFAQEPAHDPTRAMVRVKSHGASGTVIATREGRSWSLSCAHMILDPKNQVNREALERVLRLDGPPQPQAIHSKANARIVAYDVQLDLSLIEIDNGPFLYIPVAPKGFKPGQNIQSLGYDDLKWPLTVKSATILGTSGDTTYTAEKPWHGRSGGALIDADANVLIGVVQGYEVRPRSRGLYVSHDAILRFLAKHGSKIQPMPAERPSQPRWQPPHWQPAFPIFPIPGGC